MIKKLKEKSTLDEEKIEKLILKLISYNFINDKTYISLKFKSKLKKQNKSPFLIYQELLSKKFPEDELKKELSKVDEKEELDIISKLIEKKKKQTDDKQKIIEFLMRKGFSYSKIFYQIENL